MSPRHLRARCRVDAPTMAKRLGISVQDLAALERTDLPLWDLSALAQYAAALGFVLKVVAVDSRGIENVLN